MDQLIQAISERTGISVDQARQATQMVLGFVKEKLPAPIAAQVESALNSNTQGSQDITEQAKNAFGGLFGNKS